MTVPGRRQSGRTARRPADPPRAAAAQRRLLLLAYAVSGLLWGAFAVLLPVVQTAAAVDDGRLGIALGALAVAALPAMPWAGRLADRIGPGRAVRATLLASAAVLPWTGAGGGFTGLLAALVLLGATTGAVDVALSAATAAWESRQRERLMALGHAGFSFGVVAGALGAGLAREAGLRPLVVLLAVAAGTAVVAACVRPDDDPVAAPAAGPDAAGTPSGPYRPTAWLLLVGILVAGALLVEDGLQSWSALQLERSVHVRPAVGALGPALFAGAMGLGRIAAHALATRVDERRMLTAGGVLGVLGIAAFLTAGAAGPALAGLALAGAGLSVFVPALLSATGERARPARRGADLAAVNAVGYAGFVAGPAVVGLVSDAAGLVPALAVLGGVTAALTLAAPAVLRGGAQARYTERGVGKPLKVDA